MAKTKKDPGKYLVKQITAVVRLPKVLDSFIAKHPFLNTDETFVKAALAVKRTIQELGIPINVLTDAAVRFSNVDDTDTEE
jgi:hypothetical protein